MRVNAIKEINCLTALLRTSVNSNALIEKKIPGIETFKIDRCCSDDLLTHFKLFTK